MGALVSGMKAAEDSSAETLLDALKNVAAAERRKHATVLNYWLSIRGDRHFPPIRDLDPLTPMQALRASVALIGGRRRRDPPLGQALKAWSMSNASRGPRHVSLASRSSSNRVERSPGDRVQDEFVEGRVEPRCSVLHSFDGTDFDTARVRDTRKRPYRSRRGQNRRSLRRGSRADELKATKARAVVRGRGRARTGAEVFEEQSKIVRKHRR